MVQRGRWELDQPVPGGGLPPGGEGELGARRHHPVQRGQGQVGAHRGGRVRPPRPDLLVDHLGDLQALQHLPGRGQVPKGPVVGPSRLARAGARQPGGQFLGAAQVLLGDDAGLAGHPGRLHQVVVGASTAPLADQARHDMGNTPSSRQPPAPTTNHRCSTANRTRTHAPPPAGQAASQETRARCRRPRCGAGNERPGAALPADGQQVRYRRSGEPRWPGPPEEDT
jgi:hypothetical protein